MGLAPLTEGARSRHLTLVFHEWIGLINNPGNGGFYGKNQLLLLCRLQMNMRFTDTRSKNE